MKGSKIPIKQQQPLRIILFNVSGFFHCEHQVPDFSFDQFFGFGNIANQCFEVDFFAYQQQIYNIAVAAAGEVADKPGLPPRYNRLSRSLGSRFIFENANHRLPKSLSEAPM